MLIAQVTVDLPGNSDKQCTSAQCWPYCEYIDPT